MAMFAMGSGSIGSRRAEETELTPAQKLVVGGLGGITPIVATLMAGEYSNHPEVADAGAANFWIGFCLRAALFFVVGAVFVWLHQEVKGRWPVFRLGVTAPALIAAMIGSAPAEAKSAIGAWNLGTAEIRVAALQSDLGTGVMSDAMPFDLVFRECSILDGFLGRKCK